MKTQLKLASVALAVTGLVLNTCAVSLATVDGPNPMAVPYSVDIAHESGASQILRVTGDRTLIPEASLNYTGDGATAQETAAAQIIRATGSAINVPEAAMWTAPTADTELRAAVEQLLGSTASSPYYIPAGATAMNGYPTVEFARNAEVASMGSGEQVLWGAGSPGGINADLGTKPWVAKATDLSGSGMATAAAMAYPSWFVNNPDLVHLTGLSDYYPGVAEYLSRLNAQQDVASRLPDNVSAGERVVPGIG